MGIEECTRLEPSSRDTLASAVSGFRELSHDTVGRLVGSALAEDVGTGDITTASVVRADARAEGRLLARERLVLCGLPLAKATFAAIDPDLRWAERHREGDDVGAGDLLGTIVGSARALLTGERTALNFLQWLSGIATLARCAVQEVAGTGAVILDTRKTTPTLRDLEKYAVRIGGASNHRAGLHDAVLIKDNHIALAGGVGLAIRRALEAGFEPKALEVEVEDLEGLREAIDAGVGRVLLDNFTVEEAARAVRFVAGRTSIEVSGGLVPGRLRPYAEAGVNFLSIGRLTHSAPASDIALEVRPLP